MTKKENDTSKASPNNEAESGKKKIGLTDAVSPNRAARGKGYVIPMDKQAEIVKQLFLHQLTRKQLAAEIGITNQNLSKILLGRTSCLEKYKNYILKRLGVVL
jgi:S1-C subfamily serine protease